MAEKERLQAELENMTQSNQQLQHLLQSTQSELAVLQDRLAAEDSLDELKRQQVD